MLISYEKIKHDDGTEETHFSVNPFAAIIIVVLIVVAVALIAAN